MRPSGSAVVSNARVIRRPRISFDSSVWLLLVASISEPLGAGTRDRGSGLRPRSGSRSHSGYVGQCERLQPFAHFVADGVPERQQNTLAFMIAGSVGVRVTEVAQDNRTVDGSEDFSQVDLGRRASEHITAADASFGSNEAGALEGQQNLLQVRLGEAGALGYVSHGGRAALFFV